MMARDEVRQQDAFDRDQLIRLQSRSTAEVMAPVYKSNDGALQDYQRKDALHVLIQCINKSSAQAIYK